MRGREWTDRENDLIVAAYMKMLREEILGIPYVKAETRRWLQEETGRSKGSVEYKLQNISAILQLIGEPWIEGYKPAYNFQRALMAAVQRWLRSNSDWIFSTVWPKPHQEEGEVFTPLNNLIGELAEGETIWIDPAPTLSNAPLPPEAEKARELTRKVDLAAKDARNHKLGEAGERLVLMHEKAVLREAGRADLADRVRWVSHEDGDGAGYDIASFTREGSPRLIEVKTTAGWRYAPFYLTRNELEVSRKRQDEWVLMRLYDFPREKHAFELYPPLERHVDLIASEYMARLH